MTYGEYDAPRGGYDVLRCCSQRCYVPFLGDCKDAVELCTGRDLVTGERLSGLERAVTAFALIAGSGGAYRAGLKELEGLAGVGSRGTTLRRFVRQDEFDQIQKAIDTGGDVRLGRFFSPDNITDPRVATSQLALPGTGRNAVVGFVDVPRSALPSEPLTAFGPRLTRPFKGDDLIGGSGPRFLYLWAPALQ